jgi:hypothetical protein
MIGPNMKFQAGTLRRGLFAHNATPPEGDIEYETVLYVRTVTRKEAFVPDGMTMAYAVFYLRLHEQAFLAAPSIRWTKLVSTYS